MSFIPLHQLKVYRLAKDFSYEGWIVYQKLNWQFKKIVGDQMIRSIDSVGSNIAEAHGRFHYLDKIRFYYNARGSLFEAKNWVDLLFERKVIDKIKYLKMIKIYKDIQLALNGLINSTYKNKN